MSAIETTAAAVRPKPSKAFLRLWLGQMVSLAGSGMTGFALGVHTYRETGSATYFALVTFFATLPGILVSPLAGVVADRINRRTVMIVANGGAALATLALAALFAAGSLDLWHIYALVALASLCTGFDVPASQAAVGQLVPKEFFAQASGMMQMSRGMQYIVSPILAGTLLGVIGVSAILLIDVATFLFGIAMLFSIRIPSVVGKTCASESGWLPAIAEGVRYLAVRPGMLVIVGTIAVGNFAIGFLIVLVGPMVLSFTSETMLGVMNTLAALGMLIGSILVAAKGVPRRLVPSMFVFMAIGGVGLAAMGLWERPVPITLACFVFFLSMPFVSACQETIWRQKIELGMQGRMFAFTRMIVVSASTLAYMIAGPLADRVFNPLLLKDGALAASVGPLIGTGPGRGIALLLILCGGAILVVTGLGYLFPAVRRLESEYPDVATAETAIVPEAA